MSWLACIILAVTGESAAGNLLRNPDFVSKAGGGPERWDVYVREMEGAWAGLGDGPTPGSVALGLYAPAEYESDTVNNWSQVLAEPHAGSVLMVSGWIRAENATEAAIWLQCFDGKPLRLVGGETSTSIQPVRGTTDWTPISFTCDVPESTKAVILRCVLRAPGEAWFADLRVTTWTPADDAAPDFEDLAEPAPEQPAAAVASIDELTRKLHDAIGELMRTNEEIQERIGQMRSDIARQRREISELEREPLPLESVDEIRHPLVPADPRDGARRSP